MALVIAMVMVVGMSVTALAATVDVKTSDDYVADRTFKAYKVFAANWEGGVITNVTAGDGINWASSELITKLNAIEGITGVTDAKSLATVLDGKDVSVGEKVAKVLKDYTVSGKGTAVSNGDSLADGYYLIIDETTLGNNDVANAALLQVAGEKVTINVKTDKPSVEKKIDGNSDADTETSGLVDKNNGQIGDLVPYVITSTVPDTSYYDKYYMEFNDTVSSGLDISATDAVGDAAFSDYKIYVDNEEMDSSKYTLTVGTTARTIKVAFTNVKGLDGKILKLTYKAKINANAVVGTTGNPNEVTLKYTNSPDHSGDGDYNTDTYTSVTPKDVVITYLTGIELLKVDTTDTSKTLEGAVFSITGTRNVSTIVTTNGYVEDGDGTYYKLNDGSYTTTAPGGAIADKDYASTTTTYKPETTTETKTETSSVKVQGTTGADGTLKFNDLGAGTYTITEITAPTGYNLLSAPIVVKIDFTGPTSVSTGQEVCTWTPSIVSGADDVTFADTVAKITVKNAKGTTLPSTGGIGTTIFYTIGGILVLGAAVILIARRRMQA